MCFQLSVEYFSNLSIFFFRNYFKYFLFDLSKLWVFFPVERPNGKNLVLCQFNVKNSNIKSYKSVMMEKKSSMGKQDLGKPLQKILSQFSLLILLLLSPFIQEPFKNDYLR